MNIDPSFQPWAEALPAGLSRLLAWEIALGNEIRFASGCGLDPETQVFILLRDPFAGACPLPGGNVAVRELPACPDWQCEWREAECVLAAPAPVPASWACGASA